MSSFEFGDTFTLANAHLWIVISDPNAHSGNFVIANLTSDSRRAGTECELNKGEHPWVIKQSFVNFGDAREVTPVEEAKMIVFVGTRDVRQHSPLDPAVLQKIVTAAKSSRALALNLKKYFL
jgi:hypothetical protein